MGVDDRRRVDGKGRVTIPRPIRESLNIESGEEVLVSLEDGRVVIRPQVSREAFIESMEGCIDAETRTEGTEPADPRTLPSDWTADLP